MNAHQLAIVFASGSKDPGQFDKRSNIRRVSRWPAMLGWLHLSQEAQLSPWFQTDRDCFELE
jgi:hypothetical protein